MITKFIYKGNIYTYEGVCKFKLGKGVWVDAIMYSRDGHMYVREIVDFMTKFIPKVIDENGVAEAVEGLLGPGCVPGYGKGEIPAEEVEAYDTIKDDTEVKE